MYGGSAQSADTNGRLHPTTGAEELVAPVAVGAFPKLGKTIFKHYTPK